MDCRRAGRDRRGVFFALDAANAAQRTFASTAPESSSSNGLEIAGFGTGAAIRFEPVATTTLAGSDLRMRNSLQGLWVGVHRVLANNGTELIAGNNTEMRLAATTITGDAIGILGSGTVQSQGNNVISGNASDGPAPTVVGSK